jgi:hypothetical protein
LLGQREGRTGAAVIDWLRERTPQFRDAIEFVAIDPAAVYASAIRTPGLLPNARIVVDHFHLVKLGNDALTKVRRRVTWELRDHRGRKLDPEWANRRRLLRARERLSQSSFARMWNTIIDEAPSAQDLSAWIAKEVLRTLLSTVRTGGDSHLTRHRLHRFLTWCIDSQIPELLTLAATIDTWWPEINANIHTGITNARTEGYNRLVKQVKRVGCGFRNTENSARRIRFHRTGKQRAATQTSSLPGQNRRRHMRPIGVVLNVGRGRLDLNVAGRLADGSRAGLLMRCESRRCGGDRHGGSTRRQHRCEVQFRSPGSTPVVARYRIASGPTVSRSTRVARWRSRVVTARFHHLGSATRYQRFPREHAGVAWSWSEVLTMRFMDVRLTFDTPLRVPSRPRPVAHRR